MQLSIKINASVEDGVGINVFGRKTLPIFRLTIVTRCQCVILISYDREKTEIHKCIFSTAINLIIIVK